MIKRVIVCFITLFFCAGCFSTTLEEQFVGMATCDQLGKLKGIYFDQYSQEANLSNIPYIAERNLKPCELDQLATYCINDTYYGLNVEKISIPHTISTYAIHFEDNISTVRGHLNQHITTINYDYEEKNLNYPSLIVDPDNEEKTILFCDFTSDKD